MVRASLNVVGLGPVVARARVLVRKVLGRGAQAAVHDAAQCASQVLDRSLGSQLGHRSLCVAGT